MSGDDGAGVRDDAIMDLTDVDEVGSDDDQVLYDRACYDCVKRSPIRAEARVNDLYVRRGSSERRTITLLSKRARYLLLDERHDVVRLYAVGAAMVTAINVALDVQKREPDVVVKPTTSSLCLYDDFEPKKAGLRLVTRTRISSQICIELLIRR